jgi:hypothetical protein
MTKVARTTIEQTWLLLSRGLPCDNKCAAFDCLRLLLSGAPAKGTLIWQPYLLGVSIYFWIVVSSFYKELKGDNESGGGDKEMMA